MAYLIFNRGTLVEIWFCVKHWELKKITPFSTYIDSNYLGDMVLVSKYRKYTHTMIDYSLFTNKNLRNENFLMLSALLWQRVKLQMTSNIDFLMKFWNKHTWLITINYKRTKIQRKCGFDKMRECYNLVCMCIDTNDDTMTETMFHHMWHL